MRFQGSKTNLLIFGLVVLVVILLATVGYKISQKGSAGTDVTDNLNTVTSPSTEQSTNGSQSTVNQLSKNITVATAKEFISKHQDWVNRLDIIAQKTNNNYSDWNNGKIKTEEFLNNIQSLRQEIKILNKETDLYTEFKLSSKDQETVNYTAVTTGYAHASKDVNDFLEGVFISNDTKIKTKYADLMENKYKNDLAQLKKDLNM